MAVRCSFFNFITSTPIRLAKKFFLFHAEARRVLRRVTQKVDNMYFNFARLCVKLCETLREIFIFLLFSQPMQEMR